MIGSFGWMELLLILFIVLIIFGAGKIPQLGEGLGKAIKGFKKSINESDAMDVTPQEESMDATAPPQPQARSWSRPWRKPPPSLRQGNRYNRPHRRRSPKRRSRKPGRHSTSHTLSPWERLDKKPLSPGGRG